jgi:hypothetical protein
VDLPEPMPPVSPTNFSLPITFAIVAAVVE